MFCSLDIDECQMELHECAENATCSDTEGSYECTCDPGFTGDGFNCTSMYIYIVRYYFSLALFGTPKLLLFQMLTSALVLNHLVTHMPPVLIQLVVIFVNVLKDSLEMAPSVKVA